MTVAALALGLGGLVAVAPAASAASLLIDGGADDDAGGMVPYTIHASPGETITITNVGEACGGSESGPNFELASAKDAPTVTFLVHPNTPAGVYTGSLGDFETWEGIVIGTEEDPTSYITVIVGAFGGSGTPPPSSYQQVPMPASGSCADVKDDHLGYGTGLTGGWVKQWGEWAAGGKGAVVCGRTIAWTGGAWAIRAS